MKKISGENYSVTFNEEANTFEMQGTLRLRGLGEYAEISELLNLSIHQNKACVLNLMKLEFLNSSGIAVLSKFIINARKQKELKLTLFGSNDIPWQGKSLHNLKRLMPNLNLIFQ